MKYNYKKQMFFIECGVLYAFCCLISFALFYFFGEEREDYYEIAIEGAIVVVVFMMIFQKEYANRYVEFYKESIRFNSFRIAKIRKVMSFNLRYENITNIEASYLPVFGVKTQGTVLCVDYEDGKINLVNMPSISEDTEQWFEEHKGTVLLCLQVNTLFFSN